MDFVVRPGERSTHVLNAVSPAWTSSLAVAEYVVERIVVYAACRVRPGRDASASGEFAI